MSINFFHLSSKRDSRTGFLNTGFSIKQLHRILWKEPHSDFIFYIFYILESKIGVINDAYVLEKSIKNSSFMKKIKPKSDVVNN